MQNVRYNLHLIWFQRRRFFECWLNATELKNLLNVTLSNQRKLISNCRQHPNILRDSTTSLNILESLPSLIQTMQPGTPAPSFTALAYSSILKEMVNVDLGSLHDKWVIQVKSVPWSQHNGFLKRKFKLFQSVEFALYFYFLFLDGKVE